MRFLYFPFEAWLSRGLAVWHLDKKEPRVPDLSREPWHPSNAPLRKIQGCNHGQGKGTYPSGGSESCCSGASKQFPICFRLLGRRSQLGPLHCEVWAGVLSCTVLGVQVFPYPRYLPSFGDIIHAHLELANSVYTSGYDMQALHWPTVESASLGLSGIYIHIPRF